MHPEQQSDELFLGNATTESVRQSAWVTSRLGVQAYDINGKPIESHAYDINGKRIKYRPWFIKREEVKWLVYAMSVSSQPGAKERRSVYEKMLAAPEGDVLRDYVATTTRLSRSSAC